MYGQDRRRGRGQGIRRRLYYCVLVTLLVRHPARAQGPRLATADTLRLDLAAARALAVRSNPELRAARLDTSIARGELRQASLLIQSNPSADILTRGLGTEVGVTQEIEIAGQRGARRAAGMATVERARAGLLDATRVTLADVDRAFYRLTAINQRALLTDEVLALNQRLADVAARQLAAGDISQLEYNLATVEYGRSRARALAARREREEAASEFRRLLGLPADAPIATAIDLPAVADTAHRPTIAEETKHAPRLSSAAPVTARPPGNNETPQPATVSAAAFDSLSVDSLTALALARRPDLVERAAVAQRARAQASLARREAFPNLALRASSERLEGSDNRALRPGIGITIPSFNLNRGEVQARRAEAQQADLERAALVARIRIDVRRAVTTYRAAAAEADVLERTVLMPARENRQLLEIAYRAGKVGLPVLLLIRNQVIDAEQEYWEAWLAQRVALTDLAEATGENIAGTAALGR